MSGAFDDGGDLDLEAAEYVIGTLAHDERTAFAERLRRDAAAGAAVAGWERRLAGLGGRVDPVAPPPHAWERIERAIASAVGGATIPFKVIPGGGRQGPDTSVLRRSRNRWRAGALVSGTVAAALLIVVAQQTLRAPPSDADGATYVAAVNRGGDKPALIVRVNTKTGQVLVRPVAATTPAGRSLELWYIGNDKTPRSMGVVDKDTMHLKLPEATDNATFAITVEPPGGSKTGAPTSAPVYAGQLVKE